MAHAAPIPPEPLDALRAVLDATDALASTLSPLDLDAFEKALATRSEALQGLEATAATPGTPPPWADPRAAALQELAATVARSDARARRMAAEALDALRHDLKTVSAGQSGLAGYRPASVNTPRFADRKG
ncbi:MAG: hypothetical protein HZB55_13595 [Deltaproteobacteria bacterium]|nr:hypothetical protein [Deltaproteobacteria bacterium]